MGYRRGYYKKDGTYVQGHFTKTRTKSYNYRGEKGCVGILLVLMASSLTIFLIINQL